jgi:hypothetical protein
VALEPLADVLLEACANGPRLPLHLEPAARHRPARQSREEPLLPDSQFYGLPNVIVTPHTSWSSGRVLDGTVELFAENLRRYAAGEPLRNVVDAGAGY